MTYLLALGLIVTLGLHLLTALLAGLRYRRPTPPEASPVLPPITLIRPVCGLDPFDAETLASSFGLDYPAYEVIFCAAHEDDPAVPLVRKLITAHPVAQARLLIGEDRITANPKLNNLQKSIAAAQYDWLAMADSNLLLPRTYLRDLVAAWREDPGLVSAPPVGIRPETVARERVGRQIHNTHDQGAIQG